MRVALAQIESIPGDLKANIVRHIQQIQQAISDGAELIVFPELGLTGDRIGLDIPDVSLSRESEELQPIADASRKIDIVIGLAERGLVSHYNRYNSAFYYAEGSLLYRHRKLFLVNYSVFEEAKHYVPGNNLQAFDGRLGRLCLLVCNDMWHASAPYIGALDGAEFLITPSASARGTLKDHLDIPQTWDHMIRAYSGMMGFYTVFVNRVGVRKDPEGDHIYWGGSAIIDPRGEVVVQAPYDEEALVYGEVDLEQVAQQRFKAPILRDARLWILRQEINRLAAERTDEKGEGSDPASLQADKAEPIL
ncbi:MAG: nitrilase-related carbon-nitrogen hydrolase [Candidatus Methylomirabilales bacterium]